MAIELVEQEAGEMNEPGYERLADVLQRAYAQAATGKGRERHANDKPFHVQPMQDLIRLHGVGFATGQASKKASESLGLPTVGRQVAELLGAIVYLSGAVIALEGSTGDSDMTLGDGRVEYGWVEWDGKGPCPVPAGTLVSYRCRDSSAGVGNAIASDLRWPHVHGISASDIVAYRVYGGVEKS
jgi:hypothetical protein